jgi:hypothetical protein
MTTYRLLMLEQVARVARGSPAAVPSDRLEHDLYALVEAAAVDREQARDFGGLVSDLCAARARAHLARRVRRSHDAGLQQLDSDAGMLGGRPAPAERESARAVVAYPEWDYRVGAYHQRGAVVLSRVAPAGSGAWVEDVMTRHAALVRRVRHRFAGLRPRRVRASRQDDGPDLDLSAYVAAFADWRADEPGDDRFYAAMVLALGALESRANARTSFPWGGPAPAVVAVTHE